MVARLQTGELTREQASIEYQVDYGTLCVWLGRSKLNATIPRPKPDKAEPLAGAALKWNTLDEETVKAMDAAVVRVLSGETSALAASKADPRINARTLAQKVRSAKIAAGAPLKPRRSRYAEGL